MKFIYSVLVKTKNIKTRRKVLHGESNYLRAIPCQINTQKLQFNQTILDFNNM